MRYFKLALGALLALTLSYALAQGPPSPGTIRAIQSGTWNIGTVTTLTGVTNPVTVTGTVAATQSTSPWVTSGTSTVSGTVAATQSGTWTVLPGNIANTTAWLVTGTGGTFPVTGTFWQATQPVSLASTTITGTVAVTQSTSPWIIAGGGTAGTAASGVATIQGIASMTPVQVSQATASNLNATVVGTGTFATQSAITAASGSIASGAIASGAIASGAIAAGAQVDLLTMRGTKAPGTAAANSALVGGIYNSAGVTLTDGQQAAAQLTAAGAQIVANAGLDPCQTLTKTYTPISVTTATTTRIVAPVSAKRTYICYMLLTSAAADNVGIVEGTGGTCGSGTAGVVGGTTAANGPNFAANGGVAMGNGGFTVAATAGTNVDLCLITSAATPLAGNIAWVQQ